MCAKVCMELIVRTTHSCSPASQSRQSPLNLQVSGKGTKFPRAKAPAKPAPAAAGKTGGRAKDGSTGQNADASGQREEEARLLAAVQSVHTSAATDAVGVEDRLKVVVAVKMPCSCIGEHRHQSQTECMWHSAFSPFCLALCHVLQQVTGGKPLVLSPLKTEVCTAVESPASSGAYRIVKGLPQQQVCEALLWHHGACWCWLSIAKRLCVWLPDHPCGSTPHQMHLLMCDCRRCWNNVTQVRVVVCRGPR